MGAWWQHGVDGNATCEVETRRAKRVGAPTTVIRQVDPTTCHTHRLTGQAPNEANTQGLTYPDLPVLIILLYSCYHFHPIASNLALSRYLYLHPVFIVTSSTVAATIPKKDGTRPIDITPNTRNGRGVSPSIVAGARSLVTASSHLDTGGSPLIKRAKGKE